MIQSSQVRSRHGLSALGTIHKGRLQSKVALLLMAKLRECDWVAIRPVTTVRQHCLQWGVRSTNSKLVL